MTSRFATNCGRQSLLKALSEELDQWRKTFADFRIWGFGSYFSRKPDPNDIDVLLTYRMSPEEGKRQLAMLLRGERWQVPRLHSEKVHVKSFGGSELSDKKRIVKQFNDSLKNVKAGISLTEDQVVELLI